MRGHGSTTPSNDEAAVHKEVFCDPHIDQRLMNPMHIALEIQEHGSHEGERKSSIKRTRTTYNKLAPVFSATPAGGSGKAPVPFPNPCDTSRVLANASHLTFKTLEGLIYSEHVLSLKP